MLDALARQEKIHLRKPNENKILNTRKQWDLGYQDFPKQRQNSCVKYFYRNRGFDPNIIKTEHPSISHWDLSHSHKLKNQFNSEYKGGFATSVDHMKGRASYDKAKVYKGNVGIDWPGSIKEYPNSQAMTDWSYASLNKYVKPVTFKHEKREYDILTNTNKKRIGDSYHSRYEFYDPTTNYHMQSHNRSGIPNSRSREFNILTGK